MDPNGVIQNVFMYIALPLLGLVALAAAFSGKIARMGLCILALVVGAMFVFMPAGTITQIGTSAASGISAFLGR